MKESESVVSTEETYFAERLKKKHNKIITVISPPRCASTAFARIFWQHPDINYYSHEPFETLYYSGAPIGEVYSSLENPICLNNEYQGKDQTVGTGLIIKEMPYQIGDRFDFYLRLATEPMLFLVRDPRLSIYSRMQKKIEKGSSPFFPLSESGWFLIKKQIDRCKELKAPFMVVDTTILRTSPSTVLKKLFSRLSLNYVENLLEWENASNITLDNLNGDHNHLYGRVLSSNKLEPPNEIIPDIEMFPIKGQMRQHVLESMEVFSDIVAMDEFINI